MTIDPEAGELVYVQLAAILRELIASGGLARRVPSVKTLAQQYGVSHGSAERALAVLRDEGLIYPVTGRGYFVAGEQR